MLKKSILVGLGMQRRVKAHCLKQIFRVWDFVIQWEQKALGFGQRRSYFSSSSSPFALLNLWVLSPVCPWSPALPTSPTLQQHFGATDLRWFHLSYFIRVYWLLHVMILIRFDSKFVFSHMIIWGIFERKKKKEVLTLGMAEDGWTCARRPGRAGRQWGCWAYALVTFVFSFARFYDDDISESLLYPSFLFFFCPSLLNRLLYLLVASACLICVIASFRFWICLCLRA